MVMFDGLLVKLILLGEGQGRGEGAVCYLHVIHGVPYMDGRYILQVAGCRLKQLVYLSQSRINPSIEANRKQPKLI